MATQLILTRLGSRKKGLFGGAGELIGPRSWTFVLNNISGNGRGQRPLLEHDTAFCIKNFKVGDSFHFCIAEALNKMNSNCY